jgi:hypothetical protein
MILRRTEDAPVTQTSWSMRRFRHRSGETWGRKIAQMRTLIERHSYRRRGRQIPKPLRRGAFALAADLVLVGGRMERLEGRFLRQLAPIWDLTGRRPRASWTWSASRSA